MANLVEAPVIKAEAINAPTRVHRLVDRIGRATAIALILSVTFGPFTIPFRTTDDAPEFVGTLTWNPATLPVELSDNWIIDEIWIQDNCAGKSKGTGIPEATSMATRLTQYPLFSSLYPKYSQEEILNRLNKQNQDLADAFCQVFGNSTQTTPESDP